MINLGIIGLGKWAGVLTNASKKSHKIQIISAYSRSQKTRESYSSEFGVPCVGNIEEMLNDPSIDGVILTVPNELHFQYAKLCAEHHKHIYIEKPITNSLAEAKALTQICRSEGVGVFIGHCAKLLTGVQLINDAIQRGDLGRVCIVEGRFSNERALTLTPDNWRWYQDKAPGGPLSQIAIHQMDVLRFLGGPVSTVNATASKISPVGAEVEDQWVLGMQFKSGALGCITSSWTSPGIFEVRVVGTKGLMTYQIDQTKWGVADALHLNAQLFYQKLGESSSQSVAIKVPEGNMFLEELELFGQLILGIEQPLFDADYGTEILCMVEAARCSNMQNSTRIQLTEFLSQSK